MCAKILQLNKEAGNIRPKRYYPIIIHKVIHRHCGKDCMCLIVKFERLSIESYNGKEDAVDPAEINREKYAKASTSLLPRDPRAWHKDIGIDGNLGETTRSQQEQSMSDK